MTEMDDETIVLRTRLESINQLLADVGGVSSPVPWNGAEARVNISSKPLRCRNDTERRT
jgi:hypothetical protein